MLTQDVLVMWMTRQLDKPYIWGGDGRGDAGYDCSGLVQEFHAIMGIDPPGDQTAQGLFNYWRASLGKTGSEVLAKRHLSFGDVLFFGENRTRVTHVAIALNRTLMYEAGGGGRNCTTPEIAAVKNAKVRIRRITSRSDYLCGIRPYHFSEVVMKGK